MQVDKVDLKSGVSIAFSPGDITIIVGPNNSGKSTFLREIGLSISDYHSIAHAFERVHLSNSTETEIRKKLENYYQILRDGVSEFVLLGENRRVYISNLKGGPDRLAIGELSNAFVANLNASRRLSLSHDTPTIDLLNNKPTHPYHAFMLDNELLCQFSNKIKSAFGVEFNITRVGNPIRGYVGDKFNRVDSAQSDINTVQVGKPLQSQGDGIRSYIGILAEISAMSHPIVLLDEPEAFLHPPQAKRLATTIIQTIEPDRQAFIATHSSNFLQGCLRAQSDRLRIFRLDRASSTFLVTILDNEQVGEAFKLPAIANSNLLDCLFFNQTVICEGDADASLFSDLMSSEAESIDRFWFSAGGKHQTAKISSLLTKFGVDWRVILDLDALTDWSLLKSLSALKGLNIDDHERKIKSALRVLKNPSAAETRLLLESTIADSVGDDEAIKGVSDILSERKSTTPLKKYGLRAFNNGQERVDVENLLAALAHVGICLLPAGELESYIPGIGAHGPKWLQNVRSFPYQYSDELAALTKDIRPSLSPRPAI